MALNTGLNPNDPRYQQLVQELLRTGQMQTPMTTESQVNAQVNAPLSSGMAGAYIDQAEVAQKQKLRAAATADYTDQQAAVDTQRKLAQGMRGSQSPQGKTVGPLDVYVAPNWGEVVGDVAMKLGGGDLERRAGIRGAEIDQKRTEQAAAALDYTEGLTTEEREYEAQQTALQQAVDRELADTADATRRRGQDMVAASSAASTAASLTNQVSTEEGLNLRGQSYNQWVLPDETRMTTIGMPGGTQHGVNADGTQGDVVRVPDGAVMVDTKATATGTGPQSLEDRLTIKEFDAEAAQELARLRAKLNEEGEISKEERDRITALASAKWSSEGAMDNAKAQMLSTTELFTNALTNPSIDKFTGTLSLPRVLAAVGIGEDAWKGQAIDQQLKAGGTALIADMASIFKPMSDTDLKYLLSQFAGSTNEPEAITAWLGNNGRIALRKTYQEARAELATQEQKDRMDEMWRAVDDRLDATVAKAAYRQGIKLEDAKTIGMDREELEYMYARIAEEELNGPN